LSFGGWVQELKSKNETFNKKYLERIQQYATVSPENMKSKREAILVIYYDLRKFLEAFSIIQSSPLCDKTINEINALISQYNALLNSRLKAKTNITAPIDVVSSN